MYDHLRKDSRDTWITVLRQYACDAYPQECCGVLLGNARIHPKDRSKGNVITQVMIYPTANSAPASRRRQEFLIAPEAWLQAEQSASRQGLHIVGVYHSHPDRPGNMSYRDRQYALKNGANVIVSCDEGHYTQVRSWRWCLNCRDFVLEWVG